MKLRVAENERLVRDSSNFAILNTDRNAVKSHEQKMLSLSKQKLHEQEINKLKSDISEIKSMLAQLLGKNS